MTTTELLIDATGTGCPPGRHDRPGYHLRLATDQSDVVAAQQLRDSVCPLHSAPATPGPAGVDAGDFDDLCDHLIVWHQPRIGPRQAVGTVRLLPPHGNDAIPRAAGLDAHRLFGLMPMEPLLDSTVEVSLACVSTDHRNGAVIRMLWGGVARYLHLTGYRYLLGTGAVTLEDGGSNAASFWDLGLAGHLAPAERRCRPRVPVGIGGRQRAERPEIPALLRSCLRLGAKVCGPPAYDPRADSAAFLLLVDLWRADQRYRRHLIGSNG